MTPCTLTMKKSYFYPRSPRGERQAGLSYLPAFSATFLSTLPARGATLSSTSQPVASLFLSTLPARGATGTDCASIRRRSISIHAPREGSDPTAPASAADANISIHAPREGSDATDLSDVQAATIFLSTLPARGATLRYFVAGEYGEHFYPRSPRGERQQKQRGKSLLLFHYTTLCTNLEELFSQKGKNWENSCKGDLPYWCEGNEKTMGTSPSHGLAGEG